MHVFLVRHMLHIQISTIVFWSTAQSRGKMVKPLCTRIYIVTARGCERLQDNSLGVSWEQARETWTSNADIALVHIIVLLRLPLLLVFAMLVQTSLLILRVVTKLQNHLSPKKRWGLLASYSYSTCIYWKRLHSCVFLGMGIGFHRRKVENRLDYFEVLTDSCMDEPYSEMSIDVRHFWVAAWVNPWNYFYPCWAAGVRFPTASHQRRKKWEVCASHLGAWH